MSTVKVAGANPQWLLLDVPGAPQGGDTLPGTFAHARRFWLFEDTEWQALQEQGPVLIDLRSCPALADLYRVDGQRWRGLLMFSEASAVTLLAHLRRMLSVSFNLHHRALLNYYNPNTASYFFDACDAEELSRWLGPISQIRWFGGSWADRALGCQGWQQLLNPGLAVRPLEVDEDLSPRQREKLQTCLLEHHVWRWNRSTGADFMRLWDHLEEGLALGFTDRPVLDGWMWLRLQYPDAWLVQPLSGDSQQERLDSLRTLWQNDSP